MSQYAPSQLSAPQPNRHKQEAAAVLQVSPTAPRDVLDSRRDQWKAIVAEEGRSHLKGVIDRAHQVLTGRPSKSQPTMSAFQYVLIGVMLFLTLNLAQRWFFVYDLLAGNLRRSDPKVYDAHVAMWMPLVLLGVSLLTLIPLAAFIWRSLSPKRLRLMSTIAYWAAPVASIFYFFIVGFMGGTYGGGMTFGFFFLNVLHLATWITNYVTVKKAEAYA
ncbi:hypothetical protein ACWGJ9_09595 [Curtobacterium citreum]